MHDEASTCPGCGSRESHMPESVECSEERARQVRKAQKEADAKVVVEHKLLSNEEAAVNTAIEEITQIISTLNPGDRLILKRHPYERSKRLFTLDLKEFTPEPELKETVAGDA